MSPPQTGERGNRWLAAYTGLIIVWLCMPIAVMILFGFNDTRGKSNSIWQGFTLKWYGRLLDKPDLTGSLINSLTIAVISTVITVVIGAMIGLALGRHRFRGRGLVTVLLFVAISSPELVDGASLLSLFLQLGLPRGYGTIVIAHVMFSLAFVAVTVHARVVTLDPSLEEAARDLGATPWAAFRLVTLPALTPALTAGALLAFALSIDDFIITGFVNGNTLTFPLWIWGASRVGIPPQVNIMGTLIFMFGVALAVANALAARRRPRAV